MFRQTVSETNMDNSFFENPREQSQIKSAIVSKYFKSWSDIITKAQLKNGRKPKIGYVDLFAGPGRYRDDTVSTPILILQKAIESATLREALVTLFNDKDPENKSNLERAIASIPSISTLRYKPDIRCSEVGDNIVKMFETMNLIPTLMFLDPWGYKGLSLKLINSVIKNWACECLFFFNYNRVNPGLNNDSVKTHLDALFGEARGEQLRRKLEPLSPTKREVTILEELCAAIKELGGNYFLPFRFRTEDGSRTSHHLIFVSKHPLGYRIMKEVMARESSMAEQGVPTFEYNPQEVLDLKKQPILFEFSRPLSELESMLLLEYAGKTLTTKEIYEHHNVGKRYIEQNYKSVLRKMESTSVVKTDPPAEKRRKLKGEVTFSDSVRVTFPAIKSTV